MSGIARLVTTGRFPRAAVVAEIMGLADLCRAAAIELDRLAEHASNYETCSLRRMAHDVIRALVCELAALELRPAIASTP